VPLAALYLAMGLGRIVIGLALLLLTDTALGATAGVALGAFAPVVVGALSIRHPSRGARPGGGRSRRVLLELLHNSHALLAFFVLSNADVVVARITLDDHAAGLYAGGLILAKAVLFLPQFVMVLAFPSMSSADTRRRMTIWALVSVLGIGLLATGVAWVLRDLAVQFIGGQAYERLTPDLWAFAAVGTVWAMTQLLVYRVVASQDRWMVAVVWAGLGVLVAFATRAGTPHRLLMTVLVVEGALLLVLVALSLRPARAPVAVPPAPA
jgi:O-antigen/teichoic acid export membrane protein